ncbi:inositol monophosphatase family protein [Sediminivirga luteola]|uniref:Inositol-phosphate phosphatase n=1 Tax=Sediminivirga luteola TaxID=1774748 RepID=A0A8J2TVW0_9MICO|nr:inositol monophosphatase family protein [Sediminivirga luteola]MCI2264330.1 hypothetical protein [Sediminivirga luteola]GGA05338.1 hypothetical protein GCM10011333_05280 [Sediminivirga luteola]
MSVPFSDAPVPADAPLSREELDALVPTVEDAVLLAADRARQIQQDPVISTKSSASDLVTNADTAVEEILRRELGRVLPAAAFIGEESAGTVVPAPAGESAPGAAGQTGAGGLAWIVDPIDGTTNFVYGLPYAVCVALSAGGRPVLGVVAEVTAGRLYTATAGTGQVWIRSEESREQMRPVVRGHGLSEALIATGFPYDLAQAPTAFALGQQIHERGRDLRRIGAASLDVVYTALGRVDGYAELNLRAWDIAAAQVIAQESGVVVTDWTGEELLLTDPAAALQVVAARQPLHAELLELIRRVR